MAEGAGARWGGAVVASVVLALIAAGLGGVPAGAGSTVPARDAPLASRAGSIVYPDLAPDLAGAGAPTASAGTVGAPPAPVPYSQTFALHSRLGSSKVMYLDFDGFVNVDEGETYTPFDLDGQSAFSNPELDAIQEIWARVAEAYAAFDVDVTTADPGSAAILRSGASDAQYGVRLVLGDGDGVLMTSCTPSCIGLAWTPGFGPASSSTDPGGVVRVPNFTAPNVRDLAETAVHELGHTVGLTHTFVAQTTLWSSVMTGSLNPAPLGQFTDAGSQDQYSVMAGAGLLPRADEPTRSETSSTFHETGVISGPGDTDAFTFTVPAGASPTTIAVSPSTHRPNLDLAATLTGPGGQVVATSDPPATRVDSGTASGLDASIAVTLAPGTYTLTVRGTGLAGVYSSYGSIGTYTVAVATEAGFRVTTKTLPAATIGQPYSVQLAQAGSAAPVKWKRIGKLPTGLKLTAKTGVISGVAKKKTGTFTFTVEAFYKTKAKGQPAVKHTASRTLSIAVH